MDVRVELTGLEQGRELSPEPATPTERPCSRFDLSYETPAQSPMLKITEEDDDPDSPSHLASLIPPQHTGSKRHSTYGSPMLYSLENNSSSSLFNPSGRNSATSLKYVPQTSAPMRSKSPMRSRSPVRGSSPVRNCSTSPKKPSGPFNFKSTNLTAPAIPGMPNSRASHRKGHRYKHSSVSMNLFQEPKQRAPLRINVSYPIPDFTEFMGSCTREQKLKVVWASLHLVYSLFIFLTGFTYSLHSFSTLSHLIFYDAFGCIITVLTDIMNNFDVYTKSSIKFPFGLGRMQVLFGFALSVSLIFVGCDLGSHFVEELVMGFFAEEQHDHASGHNHHNTGSDLQISVLFYEITVIMTIVVTTVSSRITATMTNTTSLKSIMMNNPTHIITLIFSTYLALNPLLLNLGADVGINEIVTLTIAVLIIYMGSNVVKYLGYIVLLSFPNVDTKKEKFFSEIETNIESLDAFRSTYSIENMVISKVHMGLVVVIINIKMAGGSDDEETMLRNQIDKVIREALISQKVETTIDINRL